MCFKNGMHVGRSSIALPWRNIGRAVVYLYLSVHRDICLHSCSLSFSPGLLDSSLEPSCYRYENEPLFFPTPTITNSLKMKVAAILSLIIAMVSSVAAVNVVITSPYTGITWFAGATETITWTYAVNVGFLTVDGLLLTSPSRAPLPTRWSSTWPGAIRPCLPPRASRFPL